MAQRIHYKVDQLATQKGWTIERLSRKADVGRNTVSQIWKNQTRSAGLEVLVKLANALGVDVTELYELIEDNGAEPEQLDT